MVKFLRASSQNLLSRAAKIILAPWAQHSMYCRYYDFMLSFESRFEGAPESALDWVGYDAIVLESDTKAPPWLMKGSKTEAQTTAVCFVPILMPRSSMSGQCLGILSIPFCTLQELKSHHGKNGNSGYGNYAEFYKSNGIWRVHRSYHSS